MKVNLMLPASSEKYNLLKNVRARGVVMFYRYSIQDEYIECIQPLAPPWIHNRNGRWKQFRKVILNSQECKRIVVLPQSS